jgi:hypothetical protein
MAKRPRSREALAKWRYRHDLVAELNCVDDIVSGVERHSPAFQRLCILAGGRVRSILLHQCKCSTVAEAMRVSDAAFCACLGAGPKLLRRFKLARRLASSAMNREWATILHDAHKGY